MKRFILCFWACSFIMIFIPTENLTAGEKSKEYGVYECVIEKFTGSYNAVIDSITARAGTTGWKLLSKVESGVPSDCQYRSTVLTLFDSSYASVLMAVNAQTAPYMVVDKINVFEDENGINVAVVNPNSLIRTVLMDNVKYSGIAEPHLNSLRELIGNSVDTNLSDKQMGQKRKKGKIDKTMGVMAGGKFGSRLQIIAELPGNDIAEISALVRKGLSSRGSKWGINLVYEVNLTNYNTIVYGVTGAELERKSFNIVKSGSDDSRDDFKCPGISHAAAYPIEIVLTEANGTITISMVDAMFRMKMFFEDAGKWAFMKNMTMPGSIANEIKGQINKGLGL